MDCRKNEGGVNAVLTFYRDVLVYDIRNYAYIEGSLLPPDDYHSCHSVQDIAEKGNIDRLSNVMSLCFAKVRELLYPYSKSQISNPFIDNEIHIPEIYRIDLSLPPSFSQSSLDLLRNLIHEYVVSTVVADWISITLPGKTDVWAAKARELENEIISSKQMRRGGLSRPVSPF